MKGISVEMDECMRPFKVEDQFGYYKWQILEFYSLSLNNINNCNNYGYF